MLDLVQLLADECGGLLPIVQLVRRGLFPIIQIGIPILLIVLGTIDLGKAVMSSDEKEVKGATSKLIKRVMMAVAIFFVVTIITLVMNLFTNVDSDDVTEGTADWRACWDAAA